MRFQLILHRLFLLMYIAYRSVDDHKSCADQRAADLAVDVDRRLHLHRVGHMAVDIKGSEYQISSHIGPSRYFFSGGGVLSISL